MEYRVEQLAAACAVTVDTVRYYQSKGLLEAPIRRGRVAIYGPGHVERIRAIRALQDRGLTLSVIGRVLEGSLGRADADLAAAVAAAADRTDEGTFTLDQVAEQTGVPTTLLRAIEKAGLRLGRKVDGSERYSHADIEVVRQGLRLLEAGFPLNELLEIGKRYDSAARDLARHAIELFDEHVRTPLKSSASEDEAAARLVEAFDELLPAVTAIVAHHFRSVLLEQAEERVST